jgi:hypothetical protein
MTLPSSAILDVAIGIAFVYLFLSLICSVINEGIAALLSLRSKNLVRGVDSLFSGSKMADGRNIVDAIYAHGLIRGLYKEPAKLDPQQAAEMQMTTVRGCIISHVPVLKIIDKWFDVNLPAYIPATTFSTALVDVISPPDPSRARVLEDVRQAIDRLPASPTRQALMSLVADTQKDLKEFQRKVEGWFNDSMDRAAGWYKSRAQNILLGIALVLTVLLNVDTIKLAQSLWNNPIQRQATVQLAQQYVDQHKDVLQNQQQLQQQAGALAQLGQQLPFPFGWTQNGLWQKRPSWKQDWWSCSVSWLQTFVGWLITTLALSLGAPFWFDTLNKFMVVRSTIKPQEKSGAEASKDS